MPVSCFEDGMNVCCCLTAVLVAGIRDDKLVVAIEAGLWKIRLSVAKFCLVKGFFGASMLHPF